MWYAPYRDAPARQAIGAGTVRSSRLPRTRCLLTRESYDRTTPFGRRLITVLDDKVHHEQIRLIYNQGPVLVLGATLCAVMMTLFLWLQLPRTVLLLWLLFVTAGAIVRLATFRIYRGAAPARRRLSVWGPLFWGGSLLAGLIWGTWPLLFYHLYSTEHLLLISTIFAGMVAVSAGSGTIYLPSFSAFSTPMMLPLSSKHLLSGNDTLAVTGVLMLMFLAVNWFLAARGNQQFRELIRARYENHELMMRLEAEKAIAERAVIAKSRFLAAASHDLRQPLHAMGLFIGALRNRESDPAQLEIIDDMARSSQALNSLFSSLLDMSRLDAGIIVVDTTHVRVRTLFEGLRAQFKQQASEKGIDLIICATEEAVWTDAVLFERVLRNLISNALQYTRQGCVRLSCQRAGESTVLVTLSDTGIGIPSAARDDVFSEYFQLNNPERDRDKGLGLGLSIVQRLCRLLEVELCLESIEGQGTRFDLKVPVGRMPPVVDAESPEFESDLGGCTIMAIDDEQQVLDSMRHVLEQWGCEVWLARSAKEALGVISTRHAIPDIILSDYRLHGDENGVDAIAAIREFLECDVPAVIITGDTTKEGLADVIDNRLRILLKPLRAQELRKVLDSLWSHGPTTGGEAVDDDITSVQWP